MLASLERLLYSVEGRNVYIHQFADSEMEGDGIYVRVRTEYPISGKVEVVSREQIPFYCLRKRDEKRIQRNCR